MPFARPGRELQTWCRSSSHARWLIAAQMTHERCFSATFSILGIFREKTWMPSVSFLPSKPIDCAGIQVQAHASARSFSYPPRRTTMKLILAPVRRPAGGIPAWPPRRRCRRKPWTQRATKAGSVNPIQATSYLAAGCSTSSSVAKSKTSTAALIRDGGFGIDSTGINLSAKGDWPSTSIRRFRQGRLLLLGCRYRLCGQQWPGGQQQRFDLSWGIGAGYDFTDKLGVVAEWQWSRSRKPMPTCGQSPWSGNSDAELQLLPTG